jgi:hypothetical protein
MAINDDELRVQSLDGLRVIIAKKVPGPSKAPLAA